MALAHWMHRAADVFDRPLPIFVLVGPTGSGKTTLVTRELAAHERVHATWLSACDGDLATKDALRHWTLITRTMTLKPSILVIDNADSEGLLGDGGGRPPMTHDALVELGNKAMPVLIMCTDLYAIPALRAYVAKDARTNAAFVFAEAFRPPSDDAVALLAREFPHVLHETLKRVLRDVNNDVRRARATLAFDAVLGTAPSTLASTHERDRTSIALDSTTMWEVLDAMLGVGTLPRLKIRPFSYDNDRERYDADVTRRLRYEVRARSMLIERYTKSLLLLVPRYAKSCTPGLGVPVYATMAWLDTLRLPMRDADNNDDDIDHVVWHVDYLASVVRYTQTQANVHLTDRPVPLDVDTKNTRDLPLDVARVALASDWMRRGVTWTDKTAVPMTRKRARHTLVTDERLDDKTYLCAMHSSTPRETNLWPLRTYADALHRFARPLAHTKHSQTFFKIDKNDASTLHV